MVNPTLPEEDVITQPLPTSRRNIPLATKAEVVALIDAITPCPHYIIFLLDSCRSGVHTASMSQQTRAVDLVASTSSSLRKCLSHDCQIALVLGGKTTVPHSRVNWLNAVTKDTI